MAIPWPSGGRAISTKAAKLPSIPAFVLFPRGGKVGDGELTSSCKK
jgi:hypothetical protein